MDEFLFYYRFLEKIATAFYVRKTLIIRRKFLNRIFFPLLSLYIKVALHVFRNRLYALYIFSKKLKCNIKVIFIYSRYSKNPVLLCIRKFLLTCGFTEFCI